MEYCTGGFEASLSHYDEAYLQEYRGTIYGITPDMKLGYFNRGWLRFARENGGEPAISEKWGLGCPILEAIDTTLRGYYEKAFLGCMELQRTWEHDYECSSARVYRLLHLDIYPLGHEKGLLMVHSILLDRLHEKRIGVREDPRREFYADGEGKLCQCGHCRRFRLEEEHEQWDWIPTWVERPVEEASLGLCESCTKHYFPEVF